MTFDELFKEHNLTPAERKALVVHLAAMRAQKTVEALQAAPSIPRGYVLVKAYSECGEFADDSPSLRHSCAEKQERGEPCERCPRRAARQQG